MWTDSFHDHVLPRTFFFIFKWPPTFARHLCILFISLGALDEVNEAVKGVEESIRKLVRLLTFFMEERPLYQ